MHTLGNHPSIVHVQQDDQAGRKCSSGLLSLLHLCAASGNQLAHGRDPGSDSTVWLLLAVSVRGRMPGFGSQDRLGARTLGGTRQWAAVGLMP